MVMDTNMLSLTVIELRRTYDDLNKDSGVVKNRVLTFLAAGFAILSYLYAGGDLFIPKETYGKIFYFIGLGMFVLALGLLFLALRPYPWHVPGDTDEFIKLKTDHEGLLVHLKESYLECIKENKAIYSKRLELFSTAVYPLIVGAIILLILKHFKG